MSDEMGGPMPQPGPQHEFIARGSGKWNVKTKFYMGGPNMPPMEADATETIEMVGPFWSQSRFQMSFMGMPMLGVATLGYDPVREKFIGSWFDSFSPYAFRSEGDLDASGKILTMIGEGVDRETLKLTSHRTVHTMTDDNNSIFEMYQNNANTGVEFLMMRNAYSRA